MHSICVLIYLRQSNSRSHPSDVSMGAAKRHSSVGYLPNNRSSMTSLNGMNNEEILMVQSLTSRSSVPFFDGSNSGGLLAGGGASGDNLHTLYESAVDASDWPKYDSKVDLATSGPPTVANTPTTSKSFRKKPTRTSLERLPALNNNAAMVLSASSTASTSTASAPAVLRAISIQSSPQISPSGSSHGDIEAQTSVSTTVVI